MNNSGDTRTISNIIQLLSSVLSVFSRKESTSLTSNSVAGSYTIDCTGVSGISIITSSLFTGSILGTSLNGAYEISFNNPSENINYVITTGDILIAKQIIK